MKLTALLPILITSLAFIVGCDSGESETEQPAAQLDVDGGLGPETHPEVGADTTPQPEAGNDVTPQPEAGADTTPQPEAGQDSPVEAPETTLCGTIGKVDGATKYTTVYFKGPLVAGRFLALAGYLIDANYAEQNAGFEPWCWGGDGKDEVYCSPITKDGTDAVAYPGSGVVIAPGHTPTATEADFAQWKWYCAQDDCPVGTIVVCSGKDEACRIENGKLSGTASYEKNQSGYSNAKCTF